MDFGIIGLVLCSVMERVCYFYIVLFILPISFLEV